MPDAIRTPIMSGSNNGGGVSPSPLRDIRKRAAISDVGGGRRNSAEHRKRTYSAPGRIGSSHLLVEDHYRVDPGDKKLLPGALANDDDWDRDIHDFFNMISLVPLVVLNGLNWNWDVLLDSSSKKTMEQAWVGDYFPLFYAFTVGYFLADLIWVLSVPRCVKSPGVIVQHHVATLLYLVVPYRHPEDRWLMGACLSVEVNTWLLIARRVFNKQGFGPWVVSFSFFSIRIKFISTMFYITWFYIRCYLYPLIWKVIASRWLVSIEKTGTVDVGHHFIAVVLQSVFCVLNFKWTFDLFRGKWRALRSKKAIIEKGL